MKIPKSIWWYSKANQNTSHKLEEKNLSSKKYLRLLTFNATVTDLAELQGQMLQSLVLFYTLGRKRNLCFCVKNLKNKGNKTFWVIITYFKTYNPIQQAPSVNILTIEWFSLKGEGITEQNFFLIGFNKVNEIWITMWFNLKSVSNI